MRYRLLLLCIPLLCPAAVSAHPVINEVMWAGSDLSTADEWIEILNPNSEAADLSGWSVTTLNSKGEHVTAARFATGSFIGAGAFYVVARKTASASRLLSDPATIAPDLVLPNTSLLLRLVDQYGTVIDEVDDGVGAPFAGANPSGSGSKATMERIDSGVSGTTKDNWRTASASLGFDDGARMLGTPGTPNSTPEIAAPTECVDTLSVRIGVQSGVPDGDGKVTLNLQAEAETGVLPSSGCRFDFADGALSSSCNPPSHTFDVPGSYPVLLQVTNRCGAIVTDTLTVIVRGEPIVPADSSARLMLHAAMPNPPGADTGKEWIEIRNPEQRTVNLAGWRLRIGITSFRWVSLKGVVAEDSVARVYDSELKLGLTNAKTEVVLIAPDDTEHSVMRWNTAPAEGRTYYSADLERITIRGTVLRALGPDALDVALNPDAAFIMGSDRADVRLLGIRVAEHVSSGDFSLQKELIENLAKGSRIEIETDDELFDADGVLQGYVYPEQRYCLQNQLLATGQWMVDRSTDFTRKEEFLGIEKPSAVIGLSGRISSDMRSETGTAVPSLASIIHDYSGLRLQEIYPSPPPKSAEVSDALLAEEWLEIGLGNHDPLILSGAMLHAGSKTKQIHLSALTVSGSIAVVAVSGLGLGLPNAGGNVELIKPDGGLISSVTYPKQKTGFSYAFSSDGTWCVTAVPTPLSDNDCNGDFTSSIKAAPSRKTATTKKGGVSSRIRSYALSYAESLQNRADSPTLILASHEDSGIIGKVLAAFFTGVFLTAFLGLFLYRTGFLNYQKSSVFDINTKK